MVDKIEEIIRRALEQGDFDHLPGQGKPLSLGEDPFEDPDWRLANHLLRSNGFSLPWIETGREIASDLEAARSRLRRAWNWQQTSIKNGRLTFREIQSDWERAVKVFHDQIEEINKRIFNYNLEVPLPQFQRKKIDSAQEIEAITKG